MTGTVLDLSARGGLLETTQPLFAEGGFDLHLAFLDGSRMKVRAQIRGIKSLRTVITTGSTLPLMRRPVDSC
jgi:hypothetical protein